MPDIQKTQSQRHLRSVYDKFIFQMNTPESRARLDTEATNVSDCDKSYLSWQIEAVLLFFLFLSRMFF